GHRPQRWTLAATAVECIGATGVEVTPARRIDRRRDLTLDAGKGAVALVDAGHFRQERCRIRRVRTLEYVLYGAGRHHSSEIHDDDSIGDMIDHTEVMADEQIGQVEALAQVHEEIDDLGLDGDVESRDAFVAD